MKRTLKFKRITLDEFNAFFRLDSPGYFIARKAIEAEEVAGALDIVEVIVLTNKLSEIELRQRIALALAPHGKAQEYLESLDTKRAEQIAIETLGRERLIEILKELAEYVKQESKVGMGVNDKVK
jgi:hypothetical protein